MDVSNSNNAYFTDPSNPVTNLANGNQTVARAIGVFDLAPGAITTTAINARTATLFSVLETAMAGERLCGVAIAEVSAVPKPKT